MRHYWVFDRHVNAKMVSSPKSRRIAGNWRAGRVYRFPKSGRSSLWGRGFPRERFLSPFLSRKRGGGILTKNLSRGKRDDRGISFCRFLFPGKVTISWINPVCVSRRRRKSALQVGKLHKEPRKELDLLFLRVSFLFFYDCTLRHSYFAMSSYNLIIGTTSCNVEYLNRRSVHLISFQ